VLAGLDRQQPSRAAGLYAKLGRLRLEQGDRAGARAAWTRALELEPDQPELQRELQELKP
jgi:cytochrome c-type biogenesis protein CcmH/NrfG